MILTSSLRPADWVDPQVFGVWGRASITKRGAAADGPKRHLRQSRDVPMHPQNDEEIVAAYEEAITPNTKLLMVRTVI